MDSTVNSIAAPSDLDLAWTISCAILVFLMQAGFALLEGGIVKTSNSINVAVKNLVDCALSFTVFSCIGFGVAFGSDYLGLIGQPGSVDILSSPEMTAFFLFQLVFCGTATTILSGAIAERTRLITFLISVFCICGVVYPIVGHWCWGGVLENTGSGWLAHLGFHDFAGATVVHVVGGFAALGAAQAVGPRRFVAKSQMNSGHNLMLAVLGVFLIWFGWWGFNGGSLLRMSNVVPLILFNTQIGAATGGLTAAALCFVFRRRLEVLPLITGVVAGLVSITAGCDIFHPAHAVLAGSVGAALAFLVESKLRSWGIDDVVSAFPAHGVAGVWGTIIVVLGQDHTSTAGLFESVSIQAVGTLASGLFSYLTILMTLKTIKCFMPLRVTEEQERQGLNVAEHGATNEVADLVLEMNMHHEKADFSQPVAVETNTEAGQIADQYNRVIERVQEEIEQHEQTNAWLKSERLRLESVLQNVEVGIFQMDSELQITKANPALLSIFSYRTATELLQLSSSSVIPWLVGTEHETLCRASLEDGNAIKDLETEVTLPTGRTIWLSQSLTPVREDDGRLVTWLGTVSDITEQKQAMLAAVEIAEAKSEAKGEFLANMSHEIRTPLNGVIGTLDLLATSNLEEQESHYVSIARTSADALLSLINDILDFSKIEAGRMELEEVEFDLREVIESTSQQFAIRAHSEGLELNCDIAADAPATVVGDPERLRQVLINLMGNAIKFTKDGEINLRVKPTSGGQLHFSVEDTGIGISPEQLENMFEAFTQADASTTREFGGTGLGLSISNQIIQLMGAKLEVISEKDVGSIFYFELDLPVRQAKCLPDERVAELLEAIPEIRGLIIDDNATNCNILENQMKQWGFQSTVCQRSELAMDRLVAAAREGQPYDLILLDYCMPVMDGIDVARLIQANPEFAGIPIILLSSNHEVLSPAQRSECGISLAMTKPVRQSRLFDSIVNVLQGRVEASVKRCQAEVKVDATEATPADDLDSTVETLVPEPTCSSPIQHDFAFSDSSPPMIDVLIVEDNHVNQIVVKQMLTSVGFSSELAGNGAEAIEKLQQRPFQVVLMDGHMPVLDGLEATIAIRRMQQTGDLNLNTKTDIIALTANVSSDARDKFLAAGVKDFLSKPVTLQRLKESLKSYHPSGTAPTDKKTAESISRVAQDFDQGFASDAPVASTATGDHANGFPVSDQTEAATAVNSAQAAMADEDVLLAGEASSTGDASLFDEQAFEQRCGADPAFKRQILSMMRTSLPSTVADLRAQAAKGNYGGLASIAHRLKGAAGDSALPTVSLSAAKVEVAARSEQQEHLSESLDALANRVKVTLEHLDSLLDSPE